LSPLVALSLGALLSGRAAAQEAADPGAGQGDEQAETAEDTPDEQIIVIGRREIARRRAEIDRDLKKLGYAARDRGDVTVYRPDVYWHPSVWVYDDGFVVVKRSPVRFEPPIEGSSPLRYLACLPPFTPMCVRLAGQTINKRKLEPQKAEVVYAIQPEVRAWQEALAHQATSVRVGQEVPALLVGTWERGEPMDPGGPTLPTPVDRRRAILTFWATRADTEEGSAVRAVVSDFVRYVVQESDTPATPAEIGAAEAMCACGALLPAQAPPASPAP